MTCLEPLLRSAAREVEGQLRPQLNGLFGSVIAAYLPQTWVFATEEGVATLRVGRDGSAEVASGAVDGADVTVHTSHARLAAALRTRRREMVPPGPLAVTPHTEKGRTAFGFLRGRLGL